MGIGIKSGAASLFVSTWIGCKALEKFTLTKKHTIPKFLGYHASYFASWNSLLCFVGIGALRAKQGNHNLLVTSIVGATIGGFYNYNQKKPNELWNDLDDDEITTLLGKAFQGMAIGAAILSFPCSL